MATTRASSKLPPKAANFQVDTRLAVLLGDSYASTERALKELVDNAWDADAENVWVTFPKAMTKEPIVIHDDGAGMTESELRYEYLFIANDRRSRKGETTPQKKRKVKGRKGVGKFAGLIAAQMMSVVTRVRGTETAIVIDRKVLQQAGREIEAVPIEVSVRPCEQGSHGTTLTLSQLDQNLHFPSADKFRQLLMRDYGREEGFSIYVDGKRLDLADVGGSVTECVQSIADVGEAKLRFAVSDEKGRLKGAGIVIRVKGRVVGKPTFLGLDQADDFPKSLLSQIYGEIEADGLESDLTGDFGSIIENSKAFESIRSWAEPILRLQVTSIYRREMQLAKARLKQKIDRRLASLPEYKRQYAEVALSKVLHKFYGESEDRLEPLVNVVLDAVEQDDYRLILEKIDEAKDQDVTAFAEALQQFGLVDLAHIAEQARNRLRLLDFLDELRSKPQTDELVMHKAIEQNLWLLGEEYGLLASNKTFKSIAEDVASKVYAGKRATERPDLLLAGNVSKQHVLIELKNPSMTLSFEHYQQATRYRHELSSYISGHMKVWIIGGRRGENALPASHEPEIYLSTFAEVIANARRQVEWLLERLAAAPA
ncbi:ATP-binding protein [Lysobacter korlensis]|uniref:ATP-binding protein n=1 Tax=Lysobacter korlensis TaxID=553636 RepID=A0ABV6RI58_9GAMM